jgi:periplasmic divalent cation tolerance protein
MAKTSELLVVLVTVPDEAVADLLSTALVQKRLVACVNIVPGIRSVYRWKGKLESSSEVLLVMKTASGGFADLSAAITAAHPYEVPEIIALNATDVSESYLSWVLSECGPEPV